ncbi:MAG: glycosyltransferase family 39 protein [Chloroflexi bacterium]|nr:glycosyltransferase family 39 protein [Chloroflexota bacterium]
MNHTRLPYEHWLILLITLLAFGLRVWQLNRVPPGWRDDELIETLIISQRVLDGEWAVYYADASGHEALYHVLNAAMLALFGPTTWGIRLLSVILGTLTVPLTYLLGRRLFGSTVGLLAAALLATSFWSLMYSRIGLRHILLTPLVLAAFYFFWRGLQKSRWAGWFDGRSPLLSYLLTAVFLALGFYTYFAGRGLPLILVAFMGYLAVFAWPLFRRHWPGFALLLATAVFLAVPLIVTLRQQPESEARVAELALPLVEAQIGNFAPIWQYTLTTLSMFHNSGDPEWLYNIPQRPIFGPVGAGLFWLGVALAGWYALQPAAATLRALAVRTRRPAAAPIHLSSAFLLIWWLAGIAPGFISVPPASLGHTIMSQSAVYMLSALPVGWLATMGRKKYAVDRLRNTAYGLRLTAVTLGLLLFISTGWRDAQDYFVNWPARGMVRFLYRAEVHETAVYLNNHPDITDVGLTSVLAGPWDQAALDIDLQTAVQPRWYNPDRALLLQPSLVLAGWPQPPQFLPEAYTPLAERPSIGAYRFYTIDYDFPPGEKVCFVNGLCLETAVYDSVTGRLTLVWQVGEAFDLPPMPLISNPPPPGVYAGPRLSVFAHLLDAAGGLLTGDDGLWVDARYLQPGDRFAQFHQLTPPDGALAGGVAFGLYDPMTGKRIPTVDGRDSLQLRIDQRGDAENREIK